LKRTEKKKLTRNSNGDKKTMKDRPCRISQAGLKGGGKTILDGGRKGRKRGQKKSERNPGWSKGKVILGTVNRGKEEIWGPQKSWGT